MSYISVWLLHELIKDMRIVCYVRCSDWSFHHITQYKNERAFNLLGKEEIISLGLLEICISYDIWKFGKIVVWCMCKAIEGPCLVGWLNLISPCRKKYSEQNKVLYVEGLGDVCTISSRSPCNDAFWTSNWWTCETQFK